MGRYFWMKPSEKEKDHEQPGCMFGLAHVLGYHLFHGSRKKIQHHKDEGQRNERRGRSCQPQVYQYDDIETENLLGETKSRYLSGRRAVENKKRSHKSRIRSLIAEEIAEENGEVHGKGGSFKQKLERTYSMHHQLPPDVDCIKRNPGNVTETKAAGNQEASRGRSNGSSKNLAKHDSKQNHDVLEMFGVDKVMLRKHLQDAKAKLGFTPKAKLHKSRSFPGTRLSQGRELKPLKIESKHREVWSYPRKSKFRSVSLKSYLSDYVGTIPGELADDSASNGTLGGNTNQDTQTSNVLAMDHSKSANKFLISGNNGEEIADGMSDNAMGRKGEKPSRSTSLKESLEKYAQLFENSFPANAKLSSSKSLKVANEYVLAPVPSRRILSLSNVDFYYLTSTFEALDNDPHENGSIETANTTESCLQNSDEENIAGIPASDGNNDLNTWKNEVADECSVLQINEDDECLSTSDVDSEENEEEKTNSLWETNDSDASQIEPSNQCFIMDSDISLQEAESHAELQTSEGFEHESSINELNFSSHSDETKVLPRKPLEKHGIIDFENDQIPYKITQSYVHDRCPDMNVSDLNYVKHLLDQSGISTVASDMSWHTYDKPFSPELFEVAEACWPHDQDQLTGWPDFYGCWHHRMLFDLVNDALLELYNTSLPYYPRALSSGCQVRPFPAGNRIVDEVSTTINTLLNFKPEEMETLDEILAFDVTQDCSWLNLQMESECVAIELEDMIFDEVLEEVMLCL